MPPEEDEDAPDDVDGRFFGGGVTRDTADALDFVDERDKDDTVSKRWITFGTLRVLT